MKNEELEKHILEYKNSELRIKRCFDGLVEKLSKILYNYNESMRASKEALIGLERFISINKIDKRSLEYKNLYNSIEPSVKTKVTQSEFIRIKNKIPDITKIAKGW